MAWLLFSLRSSLLVRRSFTAPHYSRAENARENCHGSEEISNARNNQDSVFKNLTLPAEKRDLDPQSSVPSLENRTLAAEKWVPDPQSRALFLENRTLAAEKGAGTRNPAFCFFETEPCPQKKGPGPAIQHSVF
jgi:hypothetical protein